MGDSPLTRETQGKLLRREFVPVIEVDGLTKSYDDKTVVDDVTFSVEEGEIFAIVGPNGAGKTTTVESIAGLRPPTQGESKCSVSIHSWIGRRCEASSGCNSRRAGFRTV